MVKFPSFNIDWRKKEAKKQEEYIITEPILKPVMDRHSFDIYLRSMAKFQKLAEKTEESFKRLRMWKKSKKNGAILKELYNFFRFTFKEYWGELTTLYTHGGEYSLPQELRNADKAVHLIHSHIELYEEDEIHIIENFIFDSFNDFYDVVIKNWRPIWEQYRTPGYILEEVKRIRTDEAVGFGEP